MQLQPTVSESVYSITDPETQLVLKSRDNTFNYEETKSEKVAFYAVVLTGCGLAIFFWITSVALTFCYALMIRKSEDDIAIASIPLVILIVVFLFILPLLFWSHPNRHECDDCPGCYPYLALILGLIMLVAGVLVTLSAVKASSSADKAFGAATAVVDLIFGVGILCTVLYYCTQQRR